MPRYRATMLLGVVVWLFSLSNVSSTAQAQDFKHNHSAIQHVLLISIDGMHERDLARYIQLHAHSTLAQLSNIGVTYTDASTSKPSDSFPGLLSMVTGGSPRSTGVYYDNSYDRRLSPPGSKCASVGTEVVYDESIDKNPDALDAGGGIDPAQLPLDPTKGCTPVFPHSYLRVNTIFEVIRAAGGHTAWSDKHPAYEILNGPSGKGVEDLYTPEIAANNVTDSVRATEAYDDLKVQAILNEIDGKDHTGTHFIGVPTIFGMNFQAVSVGQKLPTGGYLDSQGTPSSSLLDALNHVDQSIGAMLRELRHHSLLSSTAVIITAKHGQAPIDRRKSQIVNKAVIPSLVNAVQNGLLAQATQDDVSLLWLNDQSKTNAVVAQLQANAPQASIQHILSGDTLEDQFDNPRKDSRTPDIIVQPTPGTIYASTSSTKIAEHGGFSDDDTHVPILVASPQLVRGQIDSDVETTQIAPTILQFLGLNPGALQAVHLERTQALPGLALNDSGNDD